VLEAWLLERCVCMQACHERGALPVQPDAFGQVLQLVRADVSLESGYT